MLQYLKWALEGDMIVQMLFRECKANLLHCNFPLLFCFYMHIVYLWNAQKSHCGGNYFTWTGTSVHAW